MKENYVQELWIDKVGGLENFQNLKPDDALFEEFIERKSYLIALDEEYDLDIPPEVAVSTEKFIATSAHKTNHWFTPNCYFGWALHPIHGRYKLPLFNRSPSHHTAFCIMFQNTILGNIEGRKRRRRIDSRL